MLKNFWLLGVMGPLFLATFSSSPSYKLQNYGVGAGGTNNSSSPSYNLNAASGQTAGGAGNGTTTSNKSGSIETQQANVPLAPTIDNGSATYYNKLLVKINTSGSDATDYTYSIAVSTNSFATTNYMQADGTLSGTAVYQSLAAWGGAAGTMMVGLSPTTTYQAKVNAKQGTFSASAYGPIGSAATANPSLSFSITPNNVDLGTLTAGTVVSGNSSISFTFATNGAAGGAVYVAGANNGLKSVSANNTVAAVSADLSGQSQGFGVQGLTTGQTSGGPLSLVSPFNGGANTVGAETTTFQRLFTAPASLVGGTATAALKGKAAAVTPSASDYTETLTFIASASF